MNNYSKAPTPTFYFIGVTTAKSSIMKVFPKWAKALSLDACIKGFDFAPHSDPDAYREAVEFIKNDPNSLGALVTTHKIDLYNACKDQFDYLDPYAQKLGEISSISKKDGLLCGHAKDPISSGLALEHFVPDNYWTDYDGDVLLMGAGGSSLAMSLYFSQEKFGDNVPKHIILANRSLPRLNAAKEILSGLNPKITFEFVHNPTPADNDRTLAALKPHSLIVNATGLGKDGPGSPLTDDCEITFEGRLHGLTDEKLSACVEGGVNRLSIGVQTFNADIRKEMQRLDSPEYIIRRLEEISAIDNLAVVIDLLFGFPGQKGKVWTDDLKIVSELPIDGVDCYQLNVFEKSPLNTRIKSGLCDPAATLAEAADMYAESVEYFSAHPNWHRLTNTHWARTPLERNL